MASRKITHTPRHRHGKNDRVAKRAEDSAILQVKWLDTIDDRNSYTQHGFNYADRQWLPILPSARGKLLKERFDTDMVVLKTPVQ